MTDSDPDSRWPDDAPDEEAPQNCTECGAGYIAIRRAAECCGGLEGDCSEEGDS